MSADSSGFATRSSGELMPGWSRSLAIAVRSVFVVLGMGIVVQALVVVQARPQDLVSGFHGMVDIVRRSMPPDFAALPDVAWPALETLDIALFGTVMGIILAVPLSVLAAANVTPSRWLYYTSGLTR